MLNKLRSSDFENSEKKESWKTFQSQKLNSRSQVCDEKQMLVFCKTTHPSLTIALSPTVLLLRKTKKKKRAAAKHCVSKALSAIAD